VKASHSSHQRFRGPQRKASGQLNLSSEAEGNNRTRAQSQKYIKHLNCLVWDVCLLNTTCPQGLRDHLFPPSASSDYFPRQSLASGLRCPLCLARARVRLIT
jgi:hypothetical protein